jgi:hypothetical protein
VGALDDMVAAHPVSRIAGFGATAAVVPLGLTFVATGWVDGALVATSLLLATGFGAAAAARQRLDRLPLRVAESAVWGWVDGVRVLRFRACLGRGRSCRPVMRARWVPREGAPVPLQVQLASDHVCGPFVGTVVQPPVGEGHYEVEAQVGDEVAKATIAASSVREGRFDRGIVAGRRLRFDDAWDQVTASPTPSGDQPS